MSEDQEPLIPVIDEDDVFYGFPNNEDRSVSNTAVNSDEDGMENIRSITM